MKGYYKEKWEALSEKQRRIIEIAAGIFLGILACVFLFIPERQPGGSVLSINTIIALCLVMVVPKIIYNAVDQTLSLMQKSMLISIIVCVALFSLLAFVIKPAFMFPPQ